MDEKISAFYSTLTNITNKNITNNKTKDINYNYNKSNNNKIKKDWRDEENKNVT